MKYTDLTLMESPDTELAARLGFLRVLGSIHIAVSSSSSSPEGPHIVISDSQGELSKALRESSVAAIVVKDSAIMRKVFAEAAEREKPLLLIATELTCAEGRQRLRNIYRMKNLFRIAKHAGCRIGIVTLARDRESMLSVMQMIELAMLIGATRSEAKNMLLVLGDNHDS